MAILLPDRIDVTTFGEFLRDARERRGLTIQQIASETRIPWRHLDALEHGNLDAVPGGVYRRAEIRAYADAVGLDRTPRPDAVRTRPGVVDRSNQTRQSRPRLPTAACACRGRHWAQSAWSPPRRCSRCPFAEATGQTRSLAPASVEPRAVHAAGAPAVAPTRAARELTAPAAVPSRGRCTRRAGDSRRARRSRGADDHERPAGRPRDGGWHRPRRHATHCPAPHLARPVSA